MRHDVSHAPGYHVLFDQPLRVPGQTSAQNPRAHEELTTVDQGLEPLYFCPNTYSAQGPAASLHWKPPQGRSQQRQQPTAMVAPSCTWLPRMNLPCPGKTAVQALETCVMLSLLLMSCTSACNECCSDSSDSRQQKATKISLRTTRASCTAEVRCFNEPARCNFLRSSRLTVPLSTVY